MALPLRLNLRIMGISLVFEAMVLKSKLEVGSTHVQPGSHHGGRSTFLTIVERTAYTFELTSG